MAYVFLINFLANVRWKGFPSKKFTFSRDGVFDIVLFDLRKAQYCFLMCYLKNQRFLPRRTY